MTEFSKLRPIAKAYVAGVVLLGAVTVTHSVHRLYADPIGTQWLVLASLTLLTGSFTVKVPSINASISVSETFVFASVLLFGPAAGAITVLLECLVILLWMKPDGRAVHKILFNLAAPAIAIWVSGTVFFIASGIEPYSDHATPLQGLFLPLVAFTALYFLLNSWLVALAVGFETHKSPVEIWWRNFTWLSVNYFSGASVAALIVTYAPELDISTLGVIVPLLVISYLTFRTSMARVDDANKHLLALNTLYLSTIETLAMAIDAKDQITHGHIRRVQAYAVGLAKHVGVADEQLIKAIEAAALLHDMGKLAVPEYILNKPGKLTGAEFEKMKLHATVGADILSAIDFPYPVVPIVRHHHENWDGSGYPAGIKGTDIPIGARILSVVDCFDALTSDRPYRPRLADDDALAILKQRRGSMYDPLIVDMFVRVYREIAPEAVPAGPPRRALQEITSSTQTLQSSASPRLEDIASSAGEMLTLYELAGALAGHASLSDTGDVIAKHLKRLVPFSLCVLYLYETALDELVARYALGEATPVVKGLTIPLGQRLSGWVAANRQTIINSDPTLDLGEVARCVSPRLRSCLSTPLLSEDQLVGVLSLYSDTVNGFTENHRRIIEAVARQVAPTFKRTSEFDVSVRRDAVSVRRDALTGLPSLKQLEQLVDETCSQFGTRIAEMTLLFVDVVGLKQINDRHGRAVGDDVLRHVARCVRSALRGTDVLFRYSSDEFVALLNAADPETASSVAFRIGENVRDRQIDLRQGGAVKVDVTVAVLSAPRDGSSLRELMVAARERVTTRPGPQEGSSVH